MQNEVKKEVKRVYELLETKQSHFCNGYSYTKEKKLKYYFKVLDSNNKVDKEKTKVFIRMDLPGDQEKGTETYYQDYAVTLKLLEDFEEKFKIHLGDGCKKPIQIRFYQNGDLRFISNLAVWFKEDKTWKWLYEIKRATPMVIDDPLKK